MQERTQDTVDALSGEPFALELEALDQFGNRCTHSMLCMPPTHDHCMIGMCYARLRHVRKGLLAVE